MYNYSKEKMKTTRKGCSRNLVENFLDKECREDNRYDWHEAEKGEILDEQHDEKDSLKDLIDDHSSGKAKRQPAKRTKIISESSSEEPSQMKGNELLPKHVFFSSDSDLEYNTDARNKSVKNAIHDIEKSLEKELLGQTVDSGIIVNEEEEDINYNVILSELWKRKGKDIYVDKLIKMVVAKKSYDILVTQNPEISNYFEMNGEGDGDKKDGNSKALQFMRYLFNRVNLEVCDMPEKMAVENLCEKYVTKLTKKLKEKKTHTQSGTESEMNVENNETEHIVENDLPGELIPEEIETSSRFGNEAVVGMDTV